VPADGAVDTDRRATEEAHVPQTTAGNTYVITEVVGTSGEGLEQAIQSGLTRAAQTLRNLDWFEVTEIRGHIGTADGTVQHYQVTMKVGFRYE
jgi:flavin-binding protein dodecin